MTITADAVTLTGTGQEDPRAPMVRLAQLFDAAPVPLHPADTSGVLAAHGTVDGQKVVAYCTDATTMGGAIGQDGCRRIVDAIDCGIRERWPVVGLWHSGGAKLGDGVEAMHGIGTMFSAMVRASGRVPQISVALGPAAGGAAYGAALTDLLVMAPAGRVFVTGPDVVRKVTGEMIDMEGLGGAAAHGRSGVVHVMADSEADAYVRTRRLCSLFARPGRFDLAQPWDGMDPGQLLPDRPRRAYDMRPLIRAILDPADGGFEELQPAGRRTS
ncbi:hypothetical protein Phou_049840 [Phytohabitans houttuyneae]|uniref:CoA carboxyltransferase N-terminal domain-containing protein n=1 Tax=Phytohabitans houttuyneae TaxID=1076126 RepID=A0A6V8KAL4_9ACTN|nr:hypothetical protein Phou_049840 [Phytohabitans houttuyneae]